MGPLTENVESFGLSLSPAAAQPVVLVDAPREVKDANGIARMTRPADPAGISLQLCMDSATATGSRVVRPEIRHDDAGSWT
jgi:hypothetical protein